MGAFRGDLKSSVRGRGDRFSVNFRRDAAHAGRRVGGGERYTRLRRHVTAHAVEQRRRIEGRRNRRACTVQKRGEHPGGFSVARPVNGAISKGVVSFPVESRRADVEAFGGAAEAFLRAVVAA
jgi:hypothetical protein